MSNENKDPTRVLPAGFVDLTEDSRAYRRAQLELHRGVRDWIPVAQINEIVEATYGAVLQRAGFVTVGPRQWSRSRLSFARDVFELRPIKGASYVPRCGFSLPFVPHVQSGVLRWHRTPKSVVFDLTIPLADLQVAPSEPPLGQMGNPIVMRELAEGQAPRNIAAAEKRWGSVSSLEELAAAFERERVRPSIGFSFYNFVQHPLAYAFTLAKLGREAEATAELAKSSHTALVTMARRLTQELGRVEREPTRDASAT
jgi:hypothetical protein